MALTFEGWALLKGRTDRFGDRIDRNAIIDLSNFGSAIRKADRVVGQITRIEARQHGGNLGLWVEGWISCDVLARHVGCGMVNGLDALGDNDGVSVAVTGIAIVTYPTMPECRLTVTGGI